MSNNTKQAPLPPNGTRNVEIETWCIPGGWMAIGLQGWTLEQARKICADRREKGQAVRITARLADGRKLVIGGGK